MIAASEWKSINDEEPYEGLYLVDAYSGGIYLCRYDNKRGALLWEKDGFAIPYYKINYFARVYSMSENGPDEDNTCSELHNDPYDRVRESMKSNYPEGM